MISSTSASNNGKWVESPLTYFKINE